MMSSGCAGCSWNAKDHCRHLDLGKAAHGQVAFVQDEFAGAAVALVPEHGLDEAHLEAAPQVEHAEAVGWDAPPRIAEPAQGPADAERVRVAAEVDAAESLARADRREVERDPRELRWRS